MTGVSEETQSIDKFQSHCTRTIAMARYSIRRLQLDHPHDLVAELGVQRGALFEEFAARNSRHPWVLKIICLEEEFPKNLLSAFSLRGLSCWLAGPASAYLFSDQAQLHGLAQNRSFIASSEALFVQELRAFLEHEGREEFVLDSATCKIILGGATAIMGVLNCTPDSFYDGGKFFSKEQAIEHGLRLAEQGANFIDVGGESTRPKGVYGEGAQPVSEQEECDRVLPVIEALSGKLDVPISIDTYKANVAEAALRVGAAMVNDVSGLLFDPRMASVVAQYKAPLVLVHTKGTPQDMQENPTYANLLDEIYRHLEKQIALALQAGISRAHIIIDPGLGFGKRMHDNYTLLRRLSELRGLGCPILVGPSRKAFVGKIFNLSPEERLEGTAAAVAIAAMNGAHLVRVHDVEQMRRVVQIADLIAGRAEYSAQ
jgi:dihydropteroate synthase